MLCSLFFAQNIDYFCRILEHSYGIRQETWLPYPVADRNRRFVSIKSVVLCCFLWIRGFLYKGTI